MCIRDRTDTELKELHHNYSVRSSASAERTINAEIMRNKRVNGAEIETGGLLFGQIDDSHNLIWVDSASGPPPDSEASESQFLCGISGTQKLSEKIFNSSRGASTFIGMWHTHPISAPSPSSDDLLAMVKLLCEQETPPRHVLMTIVGFAATTPLIKHYLYRRADIARITTAYKENKGK